MATDQEKALAERHKAFMESDYPGQRPGINVQVDFRLASAAEYSAYQLGQINRNLAKLVAILEKRGS
ncbi:hypothetical protein [Bradyrhizobium sp. USDA 4473]